MSRHAFSPQRRAEPAGRLTARKLFNAGEPLRSGADNLAIQRHLNISTPDDSQERRARDTADRILRLATPNREVSREQRPTVHAPGRGQPLPAGVRRLFEPRFNADFSGVRYRSDAAAARDADALNARAYTQGNTLTFAEGQFAPSSAEGQRLIAHELAHISQASQGGADPDRIYRETWDVDDSAKTVERGLLVQLIFTNTWTDWWNDTGWTPERKNTFRTNFESSIENTFNSNNFALKPPANAADVLPADVITQGYKPLVDISLVPDDRFSASEDWEVSVSSNPTGEFRTSSSNRRYGTLDEADNDPIAKSSSAPGVTQIPTVHEFGHFIGLDHPGHGLDEDALSPGTSEYGHSGTDREGREVHGPTDLMGGGMGLRPFYFNEWAQAVDRHIAQLRRERSIEEMRRAIEEFFRGRPEMGDFPAPRGDTQYG